VEHSVGVGGVGSEQAEDGVVGGGAVVARSYSGHGQRCSAGSHPRPSPSAFAPSRTPASSRPTASSVGIWHFHFADDRAYTLRGDADGWTLTHSVDDATPDVAATTDTQAWTRFLVTPPDDRPHDPPGVDLLGRTTEIDRFLRLLTRFPNAMAASPP
jgi:hypothetical protein